MHELQSRVLAGLSCLAKAHRGQCIAVVTHAEPARAAVLHYGGISLGEFARIAIDPGSCTTLKFDRKRGAVVFGYARALESARASARVRQAAEA